MQRNEDKLDFDVDFGDDGLNNEPMQYNTRFCNSLGFSGSTTFTCCLFNLSCCFFCFLVEYHPVDSLDIKGLAANCPESMNLGMPTISVDEVALNSFT